MADYEIFELGDVVLQSGLTLRGAKLAYKTYGKLNAAKDNVIVYPTWYSANHADREEKTGEGRALVPSNYCLIIPSKSGADVSPSPTSAAEPYDRGRFPLVAV